MWLRPRPWAGPGPVLPVVACCCCNPSPKPVPSRNTNRSPPGSGARSPKIEVLVRPHAPLGWWPWSVPVVLLGSHLLRLWPLPPTLLFSHKDPCGDIRPPWVTQEMLYLPRPFIPPAQLFCQEGNRVTFLGIGTWRPCWGGVGVTQVTVVPRPLTLTSAPDVGTMVFLTFWKKGLRLREVKELLQRHTEGM